MSITVKKFCVSKTELSFLETSALTGENVEEVFLKCTRTILTKIDGGMYVTDTGNISIFPIVNLIILYSRYTQSTIVMKLIQYILTCCH